MDRGIKIVSGGTDNHLMLVDLTPFDLTGKEVEHLLDAANITANKNTIPNDPKSAFVTSGIRIGTPAVTSRGLKEEDMETVAEAVAMMIKEGAVSYKHLDVYKRQFFTRLPIASLVQPASQYRAARCV